MSEVSELFPNPFIAIPRQSVERVLDKVTDVAVRLVVAYGRSTDTELVDTLKLAFSMTEDARTLIRAWLQEEK